MRELSILPDADILLDGARIAAIGPSGSLPAPAGTASVDAEGRIVMPGFVDAHTHACWPGDPSHRLDEWSQLAAGTPYLDLLAAGGGIMATVRAVRAAPQDHLAAALVHRLRRMLRLGTTSVEVKSGYGLSTEAELTMLRAIREAAAGFAGTVIPTALLGHAIDPDYPGGREAFVDHTVRRTLAQVSAEFPRAAVDAFCERSAWTQEETVRLLRQARDRGHPVRVHADQFHSLGVVEAAARMGALSVDHLEASTSDVLATLGASSTTGVLLPACGLHLDGRYANGRALIDAGGAACVATNLNPGSAPCYSMPLVIALAVRHAGLTPTEAIAAATVNPATLLGLHDRGTLAAGQRADLLLLEHRDERALAYELGGDPVLAVIAGGRVVRDDAGLAVHPPATLAR